MKIINVRLWALGSLSVAFFLWNAMTMVDPLPFVYWTLMAVSAGITTILILDFVSGFAMLRDQNREDDIVGAPL